MVMTDTDLLIIPTESEVKDYPMYSSLPYSHLYVPSCISGSRTQCSLFWHGLFRQGFALISHSEPVVSFEQRQEKPQISPIQFDDRTQVPSRHGLDKQLSTKNQKLVFFWINFSFPYSYRIEYPYNHLGTSKFHYCNMFHHSSIDMYLQYSNPMQIRRFDKGHQCIPVYIDRWIDSKMFEGKSHWMNRDRFDFDMNL